MALSLWSAAGEERNAVTAHRALACGVRAGSQRQHPPPLPASKLCAAMPTCAPTLRGSQRQAKRSLGRSLPRAAAAKEPTKR